MTEETTSTTSGVPADGQKTCPYCAETIKAAAIRCRWCGSDLPNDHAGPVVEPPLDAQEPAVSGASGRRDRRAVAATVVLAVLAVALGVVLTRTVLELREDPGPVTGTDPQAAGAVVLSEGAKSAGLAAATEATEAVLSYSAQTLEEDVERAEALLAGTMREQYSTTMEALREDTLRDEATVEATVVAASIISADEHDARALLFVNQTTTGKHLDQPRADLNRVVVTLHRENGDWSMTDLTAL